MMTVVETVTNVVIVSVRTVAIVGSVAGTIANVRSSAATVSTPLILTVLMGVPVANAALAALKGIS